MTDASTKRLTESSTESSTGSSPESRTEGWPGLRFAIVLHNHQPVGNLEHVVEDAYVRSYLPFLALLERRPEVRIGLHNSGCLWEWLEERHPEYGERVAPLVARGQVELVGGGFYEPILPLLSTRDRRGQLRRMRDFLEGRFGVTPRGIWLTERVWEPHLASDLAAEGIEWLCLDDTQFLQIGLAEEDLCGAYLTEEAGRMVRLFPIAMRLRYQIPFAGPEEVLATLRGWKEERPGTLRVLADDGEKFGIWPGTHALCYEQGWLDRFFDRIAEEAGWVSLVHLSAEARAVPPRGKAYLPDGSYREMTAWALPPAARRLLETTERWMEQQGREEEARRLLQGGFFRNFLARYSESAILHGRIADALDRLEAASGAMSEETRGMIPTIRDRLWAGQCNCAYWHGIFGGLYLPHLRDGVQRRLVSGETALDRGLHPGADWVDVRRADVDRCGEEEVLLASHRLSLVVSPRRGGGLLEIDDRVAGRNLQNALTRRPEAYHAELGAAPWEAAGKAGSAREVGEGGEGGEARETREAGEEKARTIHERITAKEKDLDQLLIYDRRERVGIGDRLFAAAPDASGLLAGEAVGWGDLAGVAYRVEACAVEDGVASVRLRRVALLDEDPSCRIDLQKEVRLRGGEDRFEVRYEIRSSASQRLRFVFGSETVWNLLAARAPDRYVLADGVPPVDPAIAGAGSHPGTKRLSFVDAWERVRIDLDAPGCEGWVRSAIETVSLSEGGIERNYQGTVALPYWTLDLEPGALWRGRIEVAFRHGDAALQPVEMDVEAGTETSVEASDASEASEADGEAAESLSIPPATP
ncbi:MAG: alpha-amylase/4-alpha-glucanotransferase domain-containing protein [Candidatus Eisenbacteria bacterium]